MYIEKPDATDLHDGVTEWATFLPQVYNADSIGYRPDIVGHEVTEWRDLIDPKFKGKAAILDVPAIGIMDAALCFESAGLIKYGNKGNMTKEVRSEIPALAALASVFGDPACAIAAPSVARSPITTRRRIIRPVCSALARPSSPARARSRPTISFSACSRPR
jgi:hypothetical protein